jgi:hypothetical protein
LIACDLDDALRLRIEKRQRILLVKTAQWAMTEEELTQDERVVERMVLIDLISELVPVVGESFIDSTDYRNEYSVFCKRELGPWEAALGILRSKGYVYLEPFVEAIRQVYFGNDLRVWWLRGMHNPRRFADTLDWLVAKQREEYDYLVWEPDGNEHLLRVQFSRPEMG